MTAADSSTSPSPSAGSSPPRRRVYLQPAFVVTVALLGIAALGLNAATQALQVHFKKQAVPLRAKLDDPDKGVPSTLGPWVKITEQVSLNPDVQHALGTDQFVFRNYADSRVVPKERIAELAGKDLETQERMIAKLGTDFPNAVISFAVTYYTGLADRVTHVPDVCMIAGGYRPALYDEVEDSRASFALPDGSTRRVPFRFINFEDETGRGQVPTRVVYFFSCNGAYEQNPQAVRASLQNLFERHGYYAKVELMLRDFRAPRSGSGGATPEHTAAAAAASLDAMRDLIAQALPDVERCLPDWAAIKGTGAKQ
jgi:hypothetical protein